MNPFVKLREEHQLTRNELALISKIPYSTLSAIENGTIRKLSSKVLRTLSDIFEEFDKNELSREYENFQKTKKESILRNIKGGNLNV